MITKYPLEKIVVNTSFGKLTSLADFKDKGLPEIQQSLAAITGQKAQERPAKKSISGFKLREGTIVGLKVTLRGRKMMQFLAKINAIVMPRVRDFRGISATGIDNEGNLTFGIKEHTVFPEIVLENTRVAFGVEVTLVPRSAMPREAALAFYRGLGLPLQKENSKHETRNPKQSKK
ncbi:MAG: 50S ribosomal protein L5 [bacterium]|nr:50S ribosomal protein L5 [bacterium]